MISKSSGKPLQGVTVRSGKAITTTDGSGIYSIETAPGDSIFFTYVGAKDVSILVSELGSQPITMEESQQSIGEVVVVGYTSQRRRM